MAHADAAFSSTAAKGNGTQTNHRYVANVSVILSAADTSHSGEAELP